MSEELLKPPVSNSNRSSEFSDGSSEISHESSETEGTSVESIEPKQINIFYNKKYINSTLVDINNLVPDKKYIFFWDILKKYYLGTKYMYGPRSYLLAFLVLVRNVFFKRKPFQ